MATPPSACRAPDAARRQSSSPAEARPRGLSRRRFSSMLFSSAALPFIDVFDFARVAWPEPAPASYPLFEEAVAHVLPEAGFQSRIALGDSILKLIDHGVVDRGKFFDLYGTSGPLPPELDGILDAPSDRGILLTRENANYFVNLLWPVGLANRMASNADSPLYGDSRYSFASTGGWTLGRETNGGTYFDQFPIVDLTPARERRVVAIAKSIFRPCCNNSTFFQDCNHGSALLGVLQLGAAQGLDDNELYREALAFNSFWFPAQYVRTAVLFKAVDNTDWSDVDPRVVLGFDYSAGGPWQQNVAARLAAMPGLIPPEGGGGAGCGV